MGGLIYSGHPKQKRTYVKWCKIMKRSVVIFGLILCWLNLLLHTGSVYGGNEASINQAGFENSATVKQAGNNNLAYIKQAGQNNQYTAIQQNTASGLGTNYSEASQDKTIDSNPNKALAIQINSGHSFNMAMQKQEGSNNQSTIYQENNGNGSGNNSLSGLYNDLTQKCNTLFGDNNKRNTLLSNQDGQVALQYQNGISNVAYTYQVGNFNISEIYQTDSSNKGVVVQDGTANYAKIEENGNYLKNGIYQNGSNNKASVNITYGASFSSSESLPEPVSGADYQYQIIQVGDTKSISIENNSITNEGMNSGVTVVQGKLNEANPVTYTNFINQMQ